MAASYLSSRRSAAAKAAHQGGKRSWQLSGVESTESSELESSIPPPKDSVSDQGTPQLKAGTRYPCASDFLQLLQLAGRPPLASLNHFAPCRGTSVRALSTSWLNGLVRDRSQAELSRVLGVNRNTVARWLTGKTEPRLPQLLALVEATTQRLLDFLGEAVAPAQLPSVASAYAALQLQRSLAYSRPWSHAVLRALKLDSYRALPRHEPGFIAARLGITLAEEELCLSALLRAKQIRRRAGRFHVGRVLAVDSRRSSR